MQKRRFLSLFVQNFLSHSTEKFRWGTLPGIRKFRVAKNFMHQRGGGIKFPLRKLFVTQYRKISFGNTSVFQKIRASQNFMHRKGISLNSVEKSLSHSADKIRRRTLLCFERILVSKSFKQRRGEASRFCRIFFNLTGPKKLRQGTILCFRKFLAGKNILWIRGGGWVSRFSVEVFVSLYRNISLENTLVFQKNSFIEKFQAKEGGSFTILSIFLIPQDRKNFAREPLCFSEIFWY